MTHAIEKKDGYFIHDSEHGYKWQIPYSFHRTNARTNVQNEPDQEVRRKEGNVGIQSEGTSRFLLCVCVAGVNILACKHDFSPASPSPASLMLHAIRICYHV